MRAHQAALRALSPKLRKLEKKHAGDPLRLARETRALYAANGLSIIPPETWKGAVVPALVGAAVYRAVGSVAQRAIGFLWISDLSRPDALLASVAAGLAGAATVAAGAATGPSRLSAALAAGITFLVAWRLSAATGLYWVASNAVGVVQSLLVRRRPTGA
jgi:membrane protein insertase Oxa1/YidC/SpoIIIJ